MITRNINTYVQKIICASFLLITLCSSCLYALSLNDSSKMNLTHVSKLITVHNESDVINALKLASKENLPISIMGVQHSQGGQTLTNNALVLNMLAYNQVVNFDVRNKQITVQSGMLWSDLQKFINPFQLAIKSMQSPNIFTIGGSLSVNAHGDDFRAGSVGNSIVAFNLILPNGKKIKVTPQSYPDLWTAVIGGYGLFGLVTEITLQLTDNNLYQSHFSEINLDEFPTYFQQHILNDHDVALFYAHLNIVPGTNFLREGYVISYTDTHQLPKKIHQLENPEKWDAIITPLFNMSRVDNYGKKWRWKFEKRIFKSIYHDKLVTRNNAMEKPVKFAIKIDKHSADWLQEYFIPPDKLTIFIDDLRQQMKDNAVNLLNVTIRYVPAEPQFLLSYATKDCFSVVLYFNQKITNDEISKTQKWTQQLINSALALGGNYYLTYQNFASVDQFKRAYPSYKAVQIIKQHYDPDKRFANIFYQTYLNR